jgi:protein-tyrosine kinase
VTDVAEIHQRHLIAAQIPADVPTHEIEQQLIRILKLTNHQIQRARELQRDEELSFVEAAIAIKAVRREDLLTALSKYYSYPIIYSDTDSARFSRELVVGHEPFGSVAEAIRSIRSSLVSSAVAGGVRSFVIVGPRAGSGSSFVAGNLALAFAQMSAATLLVDANLRNPRIAGMFGFDRNREGLSEALRRRAIDPPPIAYDAIPGLSIMTSGAIPPNPQELLCSEEFLTLTINLSKDFGIVIYDTPSAMDYADAHIVVARVGSAIIVARRHKTTFNDVATVTGKIRASQCNVVGSILNGF